MTEFANRIAVVTGGSTGMGRELVRLLAREGCDVATCDVDIDALAETKGFALAEAPSGTRILTFRADVSVESDLVAFREYVKAEFATEIIHLLFNNAGIGGFGSFVKDDRSKWERTFSVDWWGVYFGCRTFLPMLIGAEEGHIVNTSSINGLIGSIGPGTAHTAYSAAKFAVRGFSESLITDLRINAPQLRVSVVMPGHIGTSIVINSGKLHGFDPDTMTSEDIKRIRMQLAAAGTPVDGVSDDDMRKGIQMQGEAFRDTAPLSAASAAEIILDGVRHNQWRILVGEDAKIVDAEVRANPEQAYEPEFWHALQSRGLFGGFPT